MKVQFTQDISIGIGGELAGWHRLGEMLETSDSRAQWILDNGWAVAVEENAPMIDQEPPEAAARTEVTDSAPEKSPKRRAKK